MGKQVLPPDLSLSLWLLDSAVWRWLFGSVPRDLKERKKKDTYDNLFCTGHFTHMYTQQQDLIFSAAEGLLYWDTTSFLFTFSPYLCSLPKKQWEGPTKCKTKTVKVWLPLHLPWNNKSLSLIQLSEMSNGFLCDCLRELAFK